MKNEQFEKMCNDLMVREYKKIVNLLKNDDILSEFIEIVNEEMERCHSEVDCMYEYDESLYYNALIAISNFIDGKTIDSEYCIKCKRKHNKIDSDIIKKLKKENKILKEKLKNKIRN